MWHEKHPSWDIILWTDPTVRAHFPQLSNSLLSNISIPAWISDIVRFATLEQVGGVYFDTDTLPLLNIQVRNLMP
jgi:mannosyltransferase OCH1-like enzyme